MTFYEELGVPPDAPLDTIREAYRNVARLLHPDAQTNPVLKESAEVQMKRMNDLYETLADPERRRRYDQELREPPDRNETIIIQSSPGTEQFQRGHSGTLVWLAATAICATFIMWLATRESSAPAIYAQTWGGQRAGAAVAPVPGPSALRRAAAAILPVNSDKQRDDEILRLRGELVAANADRERLARQIAGMEMERRFQPPPSEPRRQVHEIPPSALQGAPAPPLEIALPGVPISPPAPLPALERSRWTGTWAYVPSRSDGRNRAVFQPVFIETVIREGSGRLRGQYHARFKVSNARISPDVDFRFEGSAAGMSGRFFWTGIDGAKGEVQLRLVSDNALEVVWAATELGNSMGLASGSAVLTRKN